MIESGVGGGWFLDCCGCHLRNESAEERDRSASDHADLAMARVEQRHSTLGRLCGWWRCGVQINKTTQCWTMTYEMGRRSQHGVFIGNFGGLGGFFLG